MALAASIIALIIALVLLFRAIVGLAFLPVSVQALSMQIRRLIQANNIERAVKLAGVAEAPYPQTLLRLLQITEAEALHERYTLSLAWFVSLRDKMVKRHDRNFLLTLLGAIGFGAAVFLLPPLGGWVIWLSVAAIFAVGISALMWGSVARNLDNTPPALRPIYELLCTRLGTDPVPADG